MTSDPTDDTPVGPDEGEQPDDGARSLRVGSAIESLGLNGDNPDLAWWRKSGIHKLAHRRSLLGPREFDPTLWDRFERVLDLVLDAFERHFGTVREMLDELLRKGSAATAKDALVLCRIPPSSRPVALRHFFDQADASWLPKLPNCLFATPPGPQAVLGEPGYVTLPGSPITGYLARVSSDDPGRVWARIEQLLAKEMTQSPWGHADLADASLNLAPNHAAAWAKRVVEWLAHQSFFYPGPERHLAAAAASLLERGEIETGVALSRELLALGGPRQPSYGTPSTKLGEYEYKDALDTIAPALVANAPLQGANLLSDLLMQALSENESAARWSRLWMEHVGQAVERPSILLQLATALRDAAVAAARASDPAEVARGLWTASVGTAVLRRLAMAVLATTAARAAGVALLVDASAFDAETLQEARDLLLVLAPSLEKSDREAVGRAIGASSLGDDSKSWLLEILAGSADAVEPAADPLFMRGGAVRMESPVSVEDLGKWSLDEVATYVADWRSPENSWTTTRMALGSAFQEAVSRSPRRFSEGATHFVGVGPDMLWRYLAGLREATRTDGAVAWQPVIDLVLGLATSTDWLSADWLDVRRSLASMLGHALGNQPIFVPMEDAEPVWKVIELLARDTSPAPDDEHPDGADARDYVMAAINNVRSEAVHLAVRYALWLRQSDRFPEGEHLPERIGAMLDEHLDATKDGSAAVRCAYGMALPLLAVLDRSWVEGNLENLFPSPESHRGLWEAVWAGYLGTPYTLVEAAFQVTRPKYLPRLELVGHDPALAGDEQLGERLMLLYWRGEIELDDPDDLVGLFFRHSPPKLAQEVVHWVGWAYWQQRNGQPDQRGLRRLPAFWAWRSAQAERDGRLEELGTFSWWFASGLFDHGWSVAQLERVLLLDAPLDLGDIVCERLLVLVDAHPRQVAALAELMVSREVNDDVMYGRDGLAAVVRRLAELEDPETRGAAKALRNRFVARGFRDPIVG